MDLASLQVVFFKIMFLQSLSLSDGPDQPEPLLPPQIPPDGEEEEDQHHSHHGQRHLLPVLGASQHSQHCHRYSGAFRQQRGGQESDVDDILSLSSVSHDLGLLQSYHVRISQRKLQAEPGRSDLPCLLSQTSLPQHQCTSSRHHVIKLLLLHNKFGHWPTSLNPLIFYSGTSKPGGAHQGVYREVQRQGGH